jgi:hypothetical protein
MIFLVMEPLDVISLIVDLRTSSLLTYIDKSELLCCNGSVEEK